MTTDHAIRSQIPLSLIWALWIATALGVMIGVAAAIGRTVFPDSAITLSEPARVWFMETFHRTDPFAMERPAELARVDGSFAAHRLLTLFHVLPGAAFLLLAPLQFSARVRSRYIHLHRWSGRFLLAALLATVLPGLYFGLLVPYGGLAEAAAIALFGSLLLMSMYRAVLAIRRGQVARHREWMLRVFAMAIAISTVRIVGALLDAALTPAGVRAPDIFALSVWAGWIITIAVAEVWIRYTRSHGGTRLGHDASAVIKAQGMGTVSQRQS